MKEEKDFPENPEELWSEGGFIKSINPNDPDFKEKMKYFEQDPNEELKFSCKKCNKKIGIHNKKWHEEMCNACFFNEHNM